MKPTQLNLDLSALPFDDFELADQELTIESLTASQAASHQEQGCCHFCACPCVCCT
jgi:hypothetical protein